MASVAVKERSKCQNMMVYTVIYAILVGATICRVARGAEIGGHANSSATPILYRSDI